MAEAHDKGNALEIAVRTIEATILKSCPGYSDKTFHIQSKKIINAGGVHHEIDIWVMVELGNEYNAIFIFECKNTQEKVGKNEIVIFTEKIDACGAQKGFFVAKSFTADAEAQAGKEPRIHFLRVSELPTQDIPVPMKFHVLTNELESLQVDMKVEGSKENAEGILVDLQTASFSINEAELDISKYIKDWGAIESNKRCNQFRSEAVPNGIYSLSFESLREFASDTKVLVNSQQIAKMILSGKIKASVTHAVVVSHFEVETRGRAIHVRADIPGAKINAAFATVIGKT